MPIYEYVCERCGHEFEREQRITEPPVRSCPKCRARRARRLISRTSFLLKGGGWHSDLYSSQRPAEPQEKQAGKGGDADASPAKPAEKQSDAPQKSSDKKDAKSKSGPKAAA